MIGHCLCDHVRADAPDLTYSVLKITRLAAVANRSGSLSVYFGFTVFFEMQFLGLSHPVVLLHSAFEFF